MTPAPLSGTLTQEIYLASLDPARAALITEQYHVLVDKAATVGPVTYNPALAKSILAAALASGFPIDTQIMIWGWDAYMTMRVRLNDGYAYVPSFGQPNINIAPGLSLPGVPSNYQGIAIPAGSIKVSVNATDYPPFQTSTPIAPAVPTAIGPFEYAQVVNGVMTYYFGTVSGDTSPSGTIFAYEGITYIKVPVTQTESLGITVTSLLWTIKTS